MIDLISALTLGALTGYALVNVTPSGAEKYAKAGMTARKV